VNKVMAVIRWVCDDCGSEDRQPYRGLEKVAEAVCLIEKPKQWAYVYEGEYLEKSKDVCPQCAKKYTEEYLELHDLEIDRD